MIGPLFSRLVLPSDIRGHLERMYRVVLETNAQQVVELGTRSGVSTLAFLAGVEQTGGRVWSCDVNPPDVPAEVVEHPAWTFRQGDDRVLVGQAPCQVDVLFIDTSHEYPHTLDELELYAPLVRKGGAIVMHDTSELWTGCRDAVDDWLAARHPLKVERYEHDNGLAVIWP